MDEIKLWKKILILVLKKWYILVLVGLIGSSALYYEKSQIQPPIPQTGKMYYLYTVKLSGEPIYINNKGVISEVTINNLVNTFDSRKTFLDNTIDAYDYSKYDANFNKLSLTEKLDWLNKHIYSNYLGNGLYEYVFKFDKSDPKDAEYIKASADQYLMQYIEHTVSYSRMMNPNLQYTVLVKRYIAEEADDVAKSVVLEKYIFIGFFLGVLVAGVALGIWALSKTYLRKKG